MNSRLINALLFTVCFLLFGVLDSFGDSVKITDRNIDIYGNSNQLSIGDIITIYDPDNILCGQFEVTEAGQYGVIHIYGDDLTSPEIDEGPVPGDVLTIYLNDIEISPKNIDKLIWTRNRDLIQVNF